MPVHSNAAWTAAYGHATARRGTIPTPSFRLVVGSRKDPPVVASTSKNNTRTFPEFEGMF